MQTHLIDLLRHGTTQDSTRLNGSTDIALSPMGWKQLQQVTATQYWQQIISSPLQRCAAFATALANEHQSTLLIEPDFQEMHFGDWDGQVLADIDADVLGHFWQHPQSYTPPNAEPFSDFQRRVLHAWQTYIYASNSEHTLIITHAGVIRVLVSHVLASPNAVTKIEVPHACLSRVRICRHEAQVSESLVFHNGLNII